MTELTLSKRAAAWVAACAIGMAVLAVPAPASATGTCQTVPVTTPAITVAGRPLVGSIANATLCVEVDTSSLVIAAPRLELPDNCGTPCFALYATIMPFGGGTDGGYVSFTYTWDGQPFGTSVPIPRVDTGAIFTHQEVCLLGVGTPRPC